MQIFGLGTPEIILIVFLLLLFFGKDKLPDLARSVGTAFKELKSGIFSHSSDTSEDDQKKKDGARGK